MQPVSRKHDIILDSISDTLKKDIINMIESGDENGIRQWAKTLMVEAGELKKAVQAGALAATMAASNAAAGNDIPDYIRKQANQTQFAQQSQQYQRPSASDAQRHSDEQKRIDAELHRQRGDSGRYHNQPRYDDQRRWDDQHRYGYRRYEEDPYWQARRMDDAMRRQQWLWMQQQRQYQPGYYYQQDDDYYDQPYQQQQGWYGYADEEPVQQPAYQTQPPATAQQAQPQVQPKQPVAEPPQEIVRFTFKGQNLAFYPHPTKAQIDAAKTSGAKIQQINVANVNQPVNAYVYAKDDVIHLIPLPGQF